MDVCDQIARRESILNKNVEQIEVNYLRACRLGDEDPAVLVLDPCDERGRAVADAFGVPGRVDALVADARRRGAEPRLIAGMPRRAVAATIADHFPELAALVPALDTGAGYLVVVVAAGGALAGVMPPVGESNQGGGTLRVLF
jgi:hypothetical protein